jgi:hypothetical protein
MSNTLSDESKNVVTLTYYLKSDVDQTLDALKNFTFNDVVFPDGEVLKDITFQQFQALVLALEAKNLTTLTNEAKN